ncbi:MAG: WYL domain-containing protein [Clostridia bacterium]|nr:WYL domain-containing protein [Clostridia bacterium]MBQ7093085.1 WYL domain-containing protein [Clostridia bacterium]
MAKSSRQKLKLLYIMKLLTERTDEEHSVTVPEMIEYLAEQGITAERKSVYDDIETLRLYGIDIEMHKGRHTGYYIANRLFELPELKLLVDSVQSAKFITLKKSNSLIKKIESFASKYEAQSLQRQVYVSGRVKTMNESVYYNIDKIHSAISENRQISFKYFEYDRDKEKVYRHNGKRYTLSPLALTCSNENYYLVAYDKDADMVKHYRVDKMETIEKIRAVREGIEKLQEMDFASYSKKMFSMFGGEEMQVKMRFANKLAGVVIDRFGKDIMMLKDGDDNFTVSVPIFESPQFYGWLLSLGEDAILLEPASAVEKMKKYIEGIYKKYEV